METEKNLIKQITQLNNAAVAYSGGTDSSYLLAVCLDVLGREHVLALTADSPLTPRREMAEAHDLAAALGARHIVLPSDDLRQPDIVANRPDRCYHCKFSRFQALWQVAREEGLDYLLHGENADDAVDYRPGTQAAEALGVRAPLREAGLTKAQIRALSRARGLPNWNRAANSCLASRFPYGAPLSAEGLARVEAAEEAVRQIWGVDQLRVRDHFPVARIEAPSQDIERLSQAAMRTPVIETLRELGYLYVTLDLVGYRMGSMNNVLE